MKILVICDAGNNRSVTIAHHLKYWGHDVLSAGVDTNTGFTLDMLGNWADRIIITERHQEPPAAALAAKTQLWDVGPDNYPRPFNKELLAQVRALMEQHKEEYKS